MTTIVLPAAQFEDHDDCLEAAIAHVASERKVETWELSAAWGDEDGQPDVKDISRETIIVTVD